MKLLLSWVRDFVDITVSASDIAETMALRGFEVASVERLGGSDAVIDFDQVVRDPEHPDLIQAAFNCGDGIHPSPAGYYAMGKAVDLALFR